MQNVSIFMSEIEVEHLGQDSATCGSNSSTMALLISQNLEFKFAFD